MWRALQLYQSPRYGHKDVYKAPKAFKHPSVRSTVPGTLDSNIKQAYTLAGASAVGCPATAGLNRPRSRDKTEARTAPGPVEHREDTEVTCLIALPFKRLPERERPCEAPRCCEASVRFQDTLTGPKASLMRHPVAQGSGRTHCDVPSQKTATLAIVRCAAYYSRKAGSTIPYMLKQLAKTRSRRKRRSRSQQRRERGQAYTRSQRVPASL